MNENTKDGKQSVVVSHVSHKKQIQSGKNRIELITRRVVAIQ
jgi:hypothetical protein